MAPANEFNGKVVLVTGSSRGIGEGVVRDFAAGGAHVVVTGRNRERIAAVAAECQQVSPAGRKALQIVADLTKEEDLERLVKDTITTYGKIDVLVNNAGQGHAVWLESPDFGQNLKDILAINLAAPTLLSQLCAPHLIKTQGVIINISSVPPGAGGLAFTLAKAGIDALTASLALELSPKGVRVCGVRPSLCVHPAAEPWKKNWAKHARANFLLRREGALADIVEPVRFLASSAASYMTGSSINVDGGYMASVVTFGQEGDKPAA